MPVSHPLRVTPQPASRRHRLTGAAAALAAVLIWSIYFLSLRQGALSPLGRLDLTLFRYAVPGLLLLPLLVRRWPTIRRVPPLWLAGMALGAGVPFFLLGAVGMAWAPVAHGSTLIPGTAPLFVTGIAVALFGQPLGRWRRRGLAAILVGVIALLWSGWRESAALGLGQLMFLSASLMWAIFTLSLRQSGLSALEATAVVTVPNGLAAGLYLLVGASESTLPGLPVGVWLPQLLVQGLLVGLGSGLMVGLAIRGLGAEAASALGSLTPVCATLLALAWLGEAITPATLLGLTLVTLGVVAASGWPDRATEPGRDHARRAAASRMAMEGREEGPESGLS
ncbi:DMT family transporter [Halomonas koreensis]|uniref:DMT family transporter n=1 Tax=Halomonas koreensis TaxID=245385 RepID=A0ABU1G479_9GAMM|nr:DMT family transporter [Halomonas koreensis]MDR5867761.1 DMT family transporter [Halomonas koreensis]